MAENELTEQEGGPPNERFPDPVADCTHGADCKIPGHPDQLHGDLPPGWPLTREAYRGSVPIGTRELKLIDTAVEGLIGRGRAQGVWQTARQVMLDLWRTAYLDGRKDEARDQLHKAGHNAIEIEQAVSPQARGCAYHVVRVAGCSHCDLVNWASPVPPSQGGDTSFEGVVASGGRGGITSYEAVMHCPAGVLITGMMLNRAEAGDVRPVISQAFIHEDGSYCEHTGTATVRMT